MGQAMGICPRISAAVGKASSSTDLINQFGELVNGLHLHGVYIASHHAGEAAATGIFGYSLTQSNSRENSLSARPTILDGDGLLGFLLSFYSHVFLLLTSFLIIWNWAGHVSSSISTHPSSPTFTTTTVPHLDFLFSLLHHSLL